MKKIAMLLTALFLGTLVSTPVYAAADVDVWCETDTGKDDTLSVSVETNGEATDGVLVIGYDPSVITCTEEDVTVADSVDMYSVNVVDESVKISFLAEEAVDAGSIAKIAFEVVDKSADKKALEAAVSLTGEAFGANGEAVIVNTNDKGNGGNTPDTEKKDETVTVVPGNVSTSQTGQTTQAATSAKTGDTAAVPCSVLLLAAGFAAAAFAKAGTGRKIER